MHPSEIREQQALLYFNKGYADAIQIASIDKYLKLIPPVLPSLAEDDELLPFLTLCDPRVPRTVRARLVNVRHAEHDGYEESTFVPYDRRYEVPKEPFWFRAHDGRPNRNKKPSECLAACTGQLLAGTADVLLALYTQHAPVADAVKKAEHYMDGPGSVHHYDHTIFAYLDNWYDDVKLSAYRFDLAEPNYGTVVFRSE